MENPKRARRRKPDTAKGDLEPPHKALLPCGARDEDRLSDSGSWRPVRPVSASFGGSGGLRPYFDVGGGRGGRGRRRG